MHERHEGLPAHTENVGKVVVDAALAVHRALGPGLLEVAYETCLEHELQSRGLKVARQVVMPLTFKGVALDAGYRIDLLIDDEVVVEVKAVDALAPVHESQLFTYLRFSRKRLGFLMNFNAHLLKDGLRRMIL